MDIESFRDYCLSKPLVTEELPFGPDNLVFKVAGKMFALTPLDQFNRVSLKCDPELAVSLREQYTEVNGGYHLNKKHWNTIDLTGMIGDDLLLQWVDHSYDMVVKGLPKSQREEILSQ
ncbi:MAG: MmcQ-like protein [Phycisphaeraceae bacterium]|nr:MmcQ-like protein [Phycisphaeraceae bacterium]|tara:strand:- start:208 stop:561 length:354 start_codon:yes stop_codon:yes gene_type:complete